MADVTATVDGLVPADQYGEGARRPRLQVRHGPRHIQLLLRRDLQITNELFEWILNDLLCGGEIGIFGKLATEEEDCAHF